MAQTPEDCEDVAAPLAGTVMKIVKPAGESVKEGDTIVLLECMKAEFPVSAPCDGIVEAIHCEEGKNTEPGIGLAWVKRK